MNRWRVVREEDSVIVHSCRFGNFAIVALNSFVRNKGFLAMWTCLARLLLAQIYAQNHFAVTCFGAKVSDLQNQWCTSWHITRFITDKSWSFHAWTPKTERYWGHGIYQLFAAVHPVFLGKIWKIWVSTTFNATCTVTWAVSFRKVDTPKSKPHGLHQRNWRRA